jgi:hypothetical protein
MINKFGRKMKKLWKKQNFIDFYRPISVFSFFQLRLTTTQPIITQHKLAVQQFHQPHSTSGFVTGNGRSSSI